MIYSHSEFLPSPEMTDKDIWGTRKRSIKDQAVSSFLTNDFQYSIFNIQFSI